MTFITETGASRFIATSNSQRGHYPTQGFAPLKQEKDQAHATLAQTSISTGQGPARQLYRAMSQPDVATSTLPAEKLASDRDSLLTQIAQVEERDGNLSPNPEQSYSLLWCTG